MKIIINKEEVLERLDAAASNRTPLFCPNGETADEIEGILSAAESLRLEHQLQTVTVGLGITGSYPEHPQLQRLALDTDLAADGNRFLRRAGSIKSRAFIWLDWLGVYADRPGLFPGVEVIPFMDHGWTRSPADPALMEATGFRTLQT